MSILEARDLMQRPCAGGEDDEETATQTTAASETSGSQLAIATDDAAVLERLNAFMQRDNGTLLGRALDDAFVRIIAGLGMID